MDRFFRCVRTPAVLALVQRKAFQSNFYAHKKAMNYFVCNISCIQTLTVGFGISQNHAVQLVEYHGVVRADLLITS